MLVNSKKSLHLGAETGRILFYNNEMLPWKAYELQFYNFIIKNLMHLNYKLAGLAGYIDMNLPATFFPCTGNMTFTKI